MSITFITGGARSGKSAHAEKLAAASGKEVIYIATAKPGDSEMAARIAQHKQQRDSSWQTVEECMSLGAVIAQWSKPGLLILIDCLTIWLSNLLFAEEKEFPEVGEIIPPACFKKERDALLQAIEQASGDIILVSNEVGMGVTPMGAVSRWYVDEAGRLNQAVAARANRAVLVVAGLPLMLKDDAC